MFITQPNLGLSNGQEIKICTVSQDEVWLEVPLQDFEVLKDVSKNFATVENS